MRNEFEIQSEQYRFPYHWLPHFSERGFAGWGRSLGWALEYWGYTETCFRLLHRLKFRSLLDVGCGDGRFLNYLLQRGIDARLVGVDLDERAIKFAEAFNHGLPIGFHCTDLSAVCERFDVVTAIEVLEHVPTPDVPAFLHSVTRVLNTDGLLVVCVPHKNVHVNRKHYCHYDSVSLRDLLEEAGFAVEDSVFVHRTTALFNVFRKLLCNRWYCSSFPFATRLLAAVYEKYFLVCAEKDCSHVCVLARYQSSAARAVKGP